MVNIGGNYLNGFGGILVENHLFEQQYKVLIDLGDLRSNMYILKLITDKKATTKRIIIN